MRRRSTFRSRRRYKGLLRLLAALTLAVICVLFADARLRPQLHAQAEMQACAMEEHALNNAVLSVLESGNYEGLVTVEQNKDGIVTSIRTDALQINLLKARISEAAESALSAAAQTVCIPAGSLTGLDLLAGRGPAIRIPVRMTGFADAEIQSVFSGTGINQTLHRLLLRVNAHVCLSMPNNRAEKNLAYSVCIAETVIVGTVPELYADIGE